MFQKQTLLEVKEHEILREFEKNRMNLEEE